MPDITGKFEEWAPMRIAPWQILTFAALLKACATSPVVVDPNARRIMNPDAIEDAVPRAEPMSKYGNPVSYQVEGKTYRPLRTSRDFHEQGLASWYGEEFQGKPTSSGEPYDMYAMTAAHRVLPLPTYVEVVNIENGRRAVVRVNDRGPFRKDRVLDLSFAAAVKLGVVEAGTARVRLRALAVDDNTEQPENTDEAYFVQVGAFSNEANARRMREQLKKGALEVPVQVSGVRHEDKRFFRVRVGPVADRDEALKLMQRLERMGVADTHVVVEEKSGG